MKTCNRCKKSLPEDQFGKNRSTPDGLMYQCKVCNSSRVKTYFQEKRAGTPEYMEMYRTRTITNHGLTLDEFAAMLESQDFRCKICREELVKPYIDHDHSCCPGKNGCRKCVRGILCNACNRGLGYFRDSVEFLSSAQNYLSTRTEM